LTRGAVFTSTDFVADEPHQKNQPLILSRPLMMKFLLWCILFILCWPLALLALVLYPLVWLILLPFRIVGIAVGGVLELVRSIITLPARLIGKIGK